MYYGLKKKTWKNRYNYSVSPTHSAKQKNIPAKGHLKELRGEMGIADLLALQ